MEEHLAKTLEQLRLEIDHTLAGELDGTDHLAPAIRYGVFAGGKRLRPLILCLSGAALGADPKALIPAACGLELIHGASLTLDDLPAMDGATMRRWRKTSHIVFGEAQAILASTALIARAYALVSRSAMLCGLDTRRSTQLITNLSAAIHDVANGQATDLLDVCTTQAQLELCYRQKSGALIAWAMGAGAALAGASEARQRDLTWLGSTIGLAFQIADDLLDEHGVETTGKHSTRHPHVTYRTIDGPGPASARARALMDEVWDGLADLGPDASALRELIAWMSRGRMGELEPAHDALALC